ncbi:MULTISPECIES: lytic transglycosylase domain-containing protein [Romboutsia]|uniref:Transglycosylase SLT domain protein n=1 Tax=Romboutsia hominis TaxID=1507512 RepID=A0A2P2BTC6_9FIRM|nr:MULTISPECIES: lytic transglycosylase domain-containing protein [Romboutsia]MDB8791151.1 lytic transglycosylase domain-containing protein [Romboutsia sp. 1001216sp1]MDB8800791.1 lytic transglycosylase domain-containing protein [Romboutsia sp. 1001216sp1]MDB8812190.1 lytic transglycosylase domain-containing protein [Romboutsia sp. 1001216sp1]CEI72234.1 Transglycosylase SLT domain protein [Romboutsia hominis]
MVNGINLFSNIANSSINTQNKCGCCCEKNSSFDELMLNLVLTLLDEENYNLVSNLSDAVRKKQQENSIVKERNLGLETINSSQNLKKVSVTASDKDTKSEIESAVKIASSKYGIDENLIKAVIKVESDFNPNCVSSAGAKGLMQLMPCNIKDLGVKNPFDIKENIDAGTRHLKEYIDKYHGNIEMGLMAYNGGPTRMVKRGVRSVNDIYKMPKETQNYVPKVMKYYRA